MYIVYKKYRNLATVLHQALPNSRLLNTRRTSKTVPYDDSIFIYYPHTVQNPPNYYQNLRDFFCANKKQQRELLSELGVHVPRTNKPPYIVRPLRHYQGKGFYIAGDDDKLQQLLKRFDNRSYYSSLFMRDAEYRIIFVHGVPMVRLVKKSTEPIPQDIPWNSATGTVKFVTVDDDKITRLEKKTSFLDDAENFFKMFPFDIAAMDVGWSREEKDYAVFEINFAPQVTIDRSVRKIIEHIVKGRIYNVQDV